MQSITAPIYQELFMTFLVENWSFLFLNRGRIYPGFCKNNENHNKMHSEISKNIEIYPKYDFLILLSFKWKILGKIIKNYIRGEFWKFHFQGKTPWIDIKTRNFLEFSLNIILYGLSSDKFISGHPSQIERSCLEHVKYCLFPSTNIRSHPVMSYCINSNPIHVLSLPISLKLFSV